jgi:hypothetical protein
MHELASALARRGTRQWVILDRRAVASRERRLVLRELVGDVVKVPNTGADDIPVCPRHRSRAPSRVANVRIPAERAHAAAQALLQACLT